MGLKLRLEVPVVEGNHHTTRGLVHHSGRRLKFKLSQRLRMHPGAAMLNKFQDFAIKGNAFDLAVGVIIGAAFGNIVSSLVGDIFMPIVGAITGGLDFSNYFFPLSSKVTADTLAEAKKQGAVLAWGNFLTVVINFVLAAWVLFLLVRVVNRLLQAEAAKAPALTKQELLLTEIRDTLKQQQTDAR